jgi:hypothetical protein
MALNGKSYVPVETDPVAIDARPWQILPPPRTVVPRAAADIAMRDWDALFDAVTARLASLAARSRAWEFRPDVQECVAALEQLHASLTHERARSRRLELELTDLQLTQARLRAELACSRAART